MKTTRISFTLSRVARILFLVFKSICIATAVITVACMILAIMLGIGLAAYQVASWSGVIFCIFVFFGFLFVHQLF